MAKGAGGDEGALLLDALRQAQEGERPVAGVIAVLWTWLDRHLLTLGSLHEKTPAIRNAAITAAQGADGFAGELTDADFQWLSAEPLRNAAELLARIELHLRKRDGLLARQVADIDGREVIVAWRGAALGVDDDPDDLPTDTDEEDRPPGGDEHPSPVTLAPRLTVSPVHLRGIEIVLLRTASKQWSSTRLGMRKGMTESGHTASVHLDTLGPHGISKWSADDEARTGYLDPDLVDEDEHDRGVDAAAAAVEEASEPGAVLVMPELSATPRIHDTVAAELRERTERGDDAPALTVTGLYHLRSDGAAADPGLVKRAAMATKVNEAVALAPDGSELWRHRKLSSAEGRVKPGDKTRYMEDIVLGAKLAIAPTPAGMIAILICLDAFAPHVRERVAASPAQVLLIPSLSPNVKRHRTSLEHLVQTLCGSAFVCNRGIAATDEMPTVWNEPDNRSFWVRQRESVTVPDAKRTDEHPSFVFRFSGQRRTQASAP